MKTIYNLIQLCLLVAVLMLDRTNLRAQSFSPIHTFAESPDGANPSGGMVLSGSTLYGTAELGGTNGQGTVFSVSTSGTGFTVLHTFAAPISGNLVVGVTNADGVYPDTRLVLSGNTLYGTAQTGGTNGSGTVFLLNTNVGGFTLLHTFAGAADGATPVCDIVVSGNMVYGTALGGGTNGEGTVYSINTNGTNFTVLHTFAALGGSNRTNSDGAEPLDLVLSGNTLYGITSEGGTNGEGTIYSINTNGTNFTVIHSFTALDAGTNSDGAGPNDGLILSGSKLYGVTYGGGLYGNGVVYSVSTNGTGFLVLHAFTPLTGGYPGTNADGGDPLVGVVLAGNTLVGVGGEGGANGYGTVFSVNTNGMDFRVLYTFATRSGPNDTNSDGTYPSGDMVASGNTVYGLAGSGGTNGDGLVFSLTVPASSFLPSITSLNLANSNLVINAANGAAGGTYVVLTSTNLASPFPQWTPVVTNILSASGTFTITTTNQFIATRQPQFYVLSVQ